MGEQARNVLADAMKLSVQDRAEIAEELLRSLEQEEEHLPPEEVERRWTAELARRADRAIRGESVGQNAYRALDAIEKKMG